MRLARGIPVLLHLLAVVALTILTQIGGFAWLLAMTLRARILAFALAYAALSLSAAWVAPVFGRVPLPCLTDGALRMQSPLYCVLNRHYAVPELATTLEDFGVAMAARHPGTITLVLDAGFPFLNGFPMLPHLSHHDGRKADIAFYYRNEGGYLPGSTRSPIGYFAFEDGPTDCPGRWWDLRWDLPWLQPLWPDWPLDEGRMRSALRWLAADPRIGKVLIEPHLERSIGVASAKLRFQGCRAARHDDHLHLQL
ncbi:MAG: hypothetical protein ACFBRM_11920 [Pikeienuella sp.]